MRLPGTPGPEAITTEKLYIHSYAKIQLTTTPSLEKRQQKETPKKDTTTVGVWSCSLRLADLRHRYDVGTGSWYTTQESIIHGIQYTQYSWEERTRVHDTALIWRTIRDTDTVQRASGSVLCLGEYSTRRPKQYSFTTLRNH